MAARACARRRAWPCCRATRSSTPPIWLPPSPLPALPSPSPACRAAPCLLRYDTMFVQHYPTLHCTALHCTVPHCPTLLCPVPCAALYLSVWQRHCFPWLHSAQRTARRRACAPCAPCRRVARPLTARRLCPTAPALACSACLQPPLDLPRLTLLAARLAARASVYARCLVSRCLALPQLHLCRYRTAAAAAVGSLRRLSSPLPSSPLPSALLPLPLPLLPAMPRPAPPRTPRRHRRHPLRRAARRVLRAACCVLRAAC
jgi:hypothetical protein